MAADRRMSVVQQLRGVLLRHATDLTDGQLLDRFVLRGDDAALTALVHRHGPMVWGVCRRLLRSHHDAEDAFQATFLVLMRKAATVSPRDLVGNWLYGVAYQTARNAKAMAAKRRLREKQMAALPEPAVAPVVREDVRPLLDHAMSGLPEHYRATLLLCDLEGQTRKEAARQLGLPEGTVASRLARARQLLAQRLARQGVAISSVGLAVIMAQEASAASVPPAVMASTVRAVTLLATAWPGTAAGVVSTQVLTLTEGVMRTMLVTKIKTALGAVVMAALLGTATMAWAVRDGDDPSSGDAIAQARTPAPGKGDEEVAARINRIVAELEKMRAEVQALQARQHAASTLQPAQTTAEKVLMPAYTYRRDTATAQTTTPEGNALAELRAEIRRLRDENEALKRGQSGSRDMLLQPVQPTPVRNRDTQSAAEADALRAAQDQYAKALADYERAQNHFKRELDATRSGQHADAAPAYAPRTDSVPAGTPKITNSARDDGGEVTRLRRENEALRAELQKLRELIRDPKATEQSPIRR